MNWQDSSQGIIMSKVLNILPLVVAIHLVACDTPRMSTRADMPVTKRESLKLTETDTKALENSLRRSAMEALLHDPRRARQLSEQFISTYPNSTQTPRLRRTLISTYLVEDRPDAALDALEKLRELNQIHPDTSHELAAIAKCYHRLKRTGEALGLLSAAIERTPNGAVLYMELANIHARSDQAKRIEALHSAAELNHPPAIRQIAEHFTSQQDWQQACEYWNTWQPHNTWCGTCNASLANWKKTNQFKCHLALGQFDAAEAAVTSLEHHFGFSSDEVAIMLVDLYAKMERLDALESRIGNMETLAGDKWPADQVAKTKETAMEYLQLKEFKESQEFEKLWECVKSRLPSHKWNIWDISGKKPQMLSRAVELLTTKEAKPFLVCQARSNAPDHRIALLILARLNAPELTHLLRQRIANPTNNRINNRHLDEYFYIALQKKPNANPTQLLAMFTDDMQLAKTHTKLAEYVMQLAKPQGRQ